MQIESKDIKLACMLCRDAAYLMQRYSFLYELKLHVNLKNAKETLIYCFFAVFC